MKRFISCLLLGSMILSCSVPVFGFTMEEIDSEEIFSPEIIERDKKLMEQMEKSKESSEESNSFKPVVPEIREYNLPNGLKGFTDVPSDFWGYAPIMEMTERGLFAGVTAMDVNGYSSFSPNSSMTKAQFITVVTRYLFEEELKTIKVESGLPWYSGNLDVALRYGIIDENWASPDSMNQPITRQEMSLISYNVLEYLDKDVEVTKTSSDIPDYITIGSAYTKSVLTCYSAGILSGVDSKGTFNPLGVVNRAQGATILSRLVGVAEEDIILDGTKELNIAGGVAN